MTQTLLVADDSKTIHKIVEMALKASPYDIVSVNSAQGALDAASRIPNVILLDYYMPDGTGYDVCRALKSNAQTSGIPIVMLGGSYKNFNEGLARESGADGVLMKPFKTDALLEILNAASSGQLAAPVSAPVATVSPVLAPALPVARAMPPAQPVYVAPVVQAPIPVVAPLRAAATVPMPVTAPIPMPESSVPTSPDNPHTQQIEPDDIEVVASTSQPRIPVAAAVGEQVAKSGSGLSSIALTRSEIESLIKEEVKAGVKAQLPTLLRTILGEVFQQKVLPKLMARADERVASAIDASMKAKIQEQVRSELEALLAD